MRAVYKHISNPFDTSFQLEKFDRHSPCTDEGLHFHNGYEVVFIRNGKGKIIVESRQVEYDDGALIFLGPCLPHFSFSNNDFEDNYEIVIHFDEVFVNKRINAFPELFPIASLMQKSRQALVFEHEEHQRHNALFENISELSSQDQLLSVLQLLSALSSTDAYQSLLDQAVSERYAHSKQAKAVFEFINNNFHQQISTKDIAAHVGLTPNSFCRVFKKLTGKPFISYLNEYRIHRAVKLLEETDNNISEIVFKCGFENPSYFSKVFYQIKKCSPIEYRKRYLGE